MLCKVLNIASLFSATTFASATRYFNDSACDQILDTAIVSQCKHTIKIVGHFDSYAPSKSNPLKDGALTKQEYLNRPGKPEEESSKTEFNSDSSRVKIIQVPVIIKENDEDIKRIASATETLATCSVISLIIAGALTIFTVLNLMK